MTKRTVSFLGFAFTALCLISTKVYISKKIQTFFSLAVTFGTFSYHIFMRLAVGKAVDSIMGNQADYYAPWFREKKFERPLYRFFRVNRWKEYMPTYDASLYSVKSHSYHEIAMAMCQSEVVHEVSALLSILPIFAAFFLDALPVFLTVSVIGVAVDLAFAAIQRYNRPRVIRLMERENRLKNPAVT